MLAAHGHWLAIGIPLNPGSMLAEMIDTRSGRVRYDLNLPPANLTVDGSGDLLAAVPMFTSVFPIQTPSDANGVGYRLLWASPRGRLRRIGPPVAGAPAISDGRVAYLASAPAEGVSLNVLDLRSGHSREVAAFLSPQRSIFAFDLSGSELAWLQSATTPLPPGQFTCENGQFQPVGPRHVVRTDINNAAPPIPAPIEPAPIEPSQYLVRCGPVKAAPAGIALPSKTRGQSVTKQRL